MTTPVTVRIGMDEDVHLLPEVAFKKIQDLLFVPDLDAPGREQELELYGKMMFAALLQAEAKLVTLNRTSNMHRKMFTIWQPHVRALRRKADVA